MRTISINLPDNLPDCDARRRSGDDVETEIRDGDAIALVDGHPEHVRVVLAHVGRVERQRSADARHPDGTGALSKAPSAARFGTPAVDLRRRQRCRRIGAADAAVEIERKRLVCLAAIPQELRQPLKNIRGDARFVILFY